MKFLVISQKIFPKEAFIGYNFPKVGAMSVLNKGSAPKVRCLFNVPLSWVKKKKMGLMPSANILELVPQ